MRHDLEIAGHAFRLRPVEADDADFIAALRGDPELSRYLHRTDDDPAAQRRWLDAYFERPGDYYFVIERLATSQPEGLIGLYDLDESQRRAEWGRWILRPGSQAAMESVLLLYRLAFGRLHLREIYCRTVAANAQVVSFHDRCRLTARRLIPQYLQLGGIAHDAVEHSLAAADWPRVEAMLENMAERLARRLTRRDESEDDDG